MKKLLLIMFILSSIFIGNFFQPINAALLNDTKNEEIRGNAWLSAFGNYKEADNGAEGGSQLETIIGQVIRVALSLLGVIFIIYMFLTGNDWMQAAGNEEKVNLAKSRLQSLLVGLIIVLVAFALSYGFSTVLSSFLKK